MATGASVWYAYQTSLQALVFSLSAVLVVNLKIIDAAHKWQITDTKFIYLNPFLCVMGDDIVINVFVVRGSWCADAASSIASLEC